MMCSAVGLTWEPHYVWKHGLAVALGLRGDECTLALPLAPPHCRSPARRHRRRCRDRNELTSNVHLHPHTRIEAAGGIEPLYGALQLQKRGSWAFA